MIVLCGCQLRSLAAWAGCDYFLEDLVFAREVMAKEMRPELPARC